MMDLRSAIKVMPKTCFLIYYTLRVISGLDRKIYEKLYNVEMKVEKMVHRKITMQFEIAMEIVNIFDMKWNIA